MLDHLGKYTKNQAIFETTCMICITHQMYNIHTCTLRHICYQHSRRMCTVQDLLSQKSSSAARPWVTWIASPRCHPPKGRWDWIKSEERSSKDKKVYSQLGISIKDCYPSRRIQKMYHHLWHEGSLSASGSKQNGLIMCKMADHVHSTIIVSVNITSYLLKSSFKALSKQNKLASLGHWPEWKQESGFRTSD